MNGTLNQGLFKKTQEYKKEYGENTLILMQVGAFFEVYGLQDKNGIITGSNIKEFSNECDLATPPKHVKLIISKLLWQDFEIINLINT